MPSRISVTGLSDFVIVSIESQRGAMEVHLQPDEAEKMALQLRKAAAKMRRNEP